MATHNLTNVKFLNEVQEVLGYHESNLDQVLATLQTILIELQSLHTSQASHAMVTKTSPFTPVESSYPTTQPITSQASTIIDRNHYLKLTFPNFNGEDLTRWIYKEKHFFEFQNVAPAQQVQLALFHLKGISLQWHRWLTKF